MRKFFRMLLLILSGTLLYYGGSGANHGHKFGIFLVIIGIILCLIAFSSSKKWKMLGKGFKRNFFRKLWLIPGGALLYYGGSGANHGHKFGIVLFIIGIILFLIAFLNFEKFTDSIRKQLK